MSAICLKRFSPMQNSGSLSQSVLHLNLSQESQPMGGVVARPLSSPAQISTYQLPELLREGKVERLTVLPDIFFSLRILLKLPEMLRFFFFLIKKLGKTFPSYQNLTD